MDYVRIVQDLISLDTTVPPGNNYENTINYLELIVAGLGFETQIVHIPAARAEGRTGRFNLVAHRRNPGKPRLIFYSHIDVVPAEGWPAFEPVIKDGKIFGRGAADMKGGIVGFLIAMDTVKRNKPAYDISAIFTTDEEYSQASQIRYLRKFVEPVTGASVFSLDSSFGFVSIAGLGLIQLNLTINGKSVHSAMAHTGENAVEQTLKLMHEVLNLKSRIIRRHSHVPANPDTGLKVMEGRLNINMMHGGIKANIIPDTCQVTIDRRLIPEEDIEEAEKELLDTLHSVPGVEWQIEKMFRIPTVPPCNDPITDKLANVIQNVTGNTGKYGDMGSGDLSNIVYNEWNGQDFGLGVIRPECNIHGKDEFAYLNDITDLGTIIAEFVKS